jgi:hypothetical protein
MEEEEEEEELLMARGGPQVGSTWKMMMMMKMMELSLLLVWRLSSKLSVCVGEVVLRGQSLSSTCWRVHSM